VSHRRLTPGVAHES